MRLSKIKRENHFWIVLAILFFMAMALIIRITPLFFIKETAFPYTVDGDTWFTLRQVEVMVNHFPQYNWFDPMTAFPTGKIIDWGPLFPFITAVLCLLTGATTHNAILYTSSWISPLMAALMVPVTYFIGKTVWNWKAGIVAAGLVSVVSFIYFTDTIFGVVVHHIGETLFTSLFFLVYLYYLVSVKCSISDMKNIKTMLVPVGLASLTGVLYFLALLTSTTTMLVLTVIAIFTLVQNIVDHLSNRLSETPLILNLFFLLVSTILLGLFGFKQPGLSVASYTIGLVFVNLALIAETVVLHGISAIFRERIKPYLIFLVALLVTGITILQIYPPFHSINQQIQSLLFGSSVYSVGVLNTAPLSFSSAWLYFNFALFLTAGGFLVLGYHIVKKRKIEWIFLFIWSLLMILITVQYQRFFYFSTVNIVLMSAICITEPFTWKKTEGNQLSLFTLAYPFFPHRTSENEHGKRHANKPSKSLNTNISKRSKKPLMSSENFTDILKKFCFGAVLILAIALVVLSVFNDANFGLNPAIREIREIPSDWIESLNWLKLNTPSPGVDYYQQYDASTFSYPSGAYGILAMWDAGHWITFFSHRIPITNPFQDHLGGSLGAYAFFLSQNESQADDILKALGGKYVITTSNLAVGNFGDLGLWENQSVDLSPYITQFKAPSANNPSKFLVGYSYSDAYFRTMIVRLHNFDGSLQAPGTVDYIQYTIQQIKGTSETSGGINDYARVITNNQVLNISQPHNDTPIIRDGVDVPQHGMYANVFSALPNSTVANVPALEHYRLVHESPNNALIPTMPGLMTAITLRDIKYVKIFEFVKGARIPGNGTIEVPITTNTGRTFVYSQVSQGGEFVVPYSISGNPYDVHTGGSYHIEGTNQYINVTEKDVMEGNTVS
jgi:dolichyl-diphosphooligosaccharide--protein glycosyltransferase